MHLIHLRALVPNMPDLGEVNFLTKASMSKLDILPRHLIIVGGDRTFSSLGLSPGVQGCHLGRRVS
jgi:hypothetical protein